MSIQSILKEVEKESIGEVAYLGVQPDGRHSQLMKDTIVENCKQQNITYEDAVCYMLCGGGECPVCMEPLTSSSLAVLPCKHRICLNCMVKVLMGVGNEEGKNSCPLCRAEIVDEKTLDEIEPDFDEDEDEEIEQDFDEESDTWEITNTICPQSPNSPTSTASVSNMDN